MTYKNLIAGLTILAKYTPKGLEADCTGAEHDVVYVLPRDELAEVFTEEDKKALDALGFYSDNDGIYFFT